MLTMSLLMPMSKALRRVLTGTQGTQPSRKMQTRSPLTGLMRAVAACKAGRNSTISQLKILTISASEL